MFDFKHIVEIDPKNPDESLKKLAVEIGEKEDYFSQIHIGENMVSEEYNYLTAIPAALGSRVTDSYAGYNVGTLSKEEAEALVEKFGYQIHECVKPNVKATYVVNGEEVSEESFNRKLEEFKEAWSKINSFFNELWGIE